METVNVKCIDCEAISKLDEKNVDENRSLYGAPEYCPYCGKRSLE